MAADPGAVNPTLEAIEIQLLLEGIALHYGYDFRDYAPSPLRRNIVMSMAMEGVPTISRYQERILHDPESFERFLDAAGVNVTSMFREADALLYVREEIVPWLRTFPSVQFWVAGCGTGEDVISLAIVLHESGLLHRSRIYATDINGRSLSIARTGRYPLENIASAEGDYARSGGRRSLSDYYLASGDLVRFDRSLLAGVTWARHNLSTDASFNEFHVIQCTNVLTYFSVPLQERVHRLMHDSLASAGYLILGRLESMIRWQKRDSYQRVHPTAGVYRKVQR
ncbi:MAG: protein-glutamate O-methyltransferase CheR [Chloroflexi bacterium]|nr:MAG: protein-glutamate O-methyltransferase CheR [Chloroflexota bacterium]